MISDLQLHDTELSRQKDSDWVLSKLSLIPILQRHGTVTVVGAKALGLMVAKDIDISVVVPKVEVGDWQRLVMELMDTPHVRNISAIDYYRYDENNRYDPTHGQRYSLYIGIINILGPEDDRYDTWECQIHLIDQGTFDVNKITHVRDRLTPEKRLTILKLKYWAHQVNRTLRADSEGNFKIFSPSIYEAVLEHDTVTIDQFVVHHRKSVPERFLSIFDNATMKYDPI